MKLDPNRVGSKQVQALILLAHHPKIWFSRDDIAAFLASIGQPSRDAIQAVNKAPQRGIAIERRGARDQTLYRLPARPAFDPGRLRVPATTSDRNGLEREARRVQKMVIEAYSAPVETWEEGHLSPDDRSGPVALQPPAVNRPYRDRFKFDRDGIRLAPAIGELTAKLGTYYTDGEQSELLEALIAARAGRQDGLDELVAMLVIRFGEEALAEALTRGA